MKKIVVFMVSIFMIFGFSQEKTVSISSSIYMDGNEEEDVKIELNDSDSLVSLEENETDNGEYNFQNDNVISSDESATIIDSSDSKLDIDEYDSNNYVSTDALTQQSETDLTIDNTDENNNLNSNNILDNDATAVKYSTHIEAIGWQDYKSDGQLSGTTGEGKRLEAIKINLDNSSYSGSIDYQTHVQNIGWQDYKSDGELSGTTGEALRLEAIRIRLNGDVSNYYDIYYRTHVQGLGWLGWAKNDEIAGSCGFGLRLEAIEIFLLRHGEYFDVGANSYYHKLIEYKSHVEGVGWQGLKSDGSMSGTSGQSRRLEAFRVYVDNSEYSGSVYYQSFIENDGWQDYKSDGQLSGTTGEAKRIEAVRMKLDGDIKNNYDIYYRVHSQGMGWLGWAKNDEIAGTLGYSYRIEAIEIKMCKLNTMCLETNAASYYSRNISYNSHVEGKGWTSLKYDGQTSGSVGEGKRLEAYKLMLLYPEYDGSIEYKSYIEDVGWESEYKNNGQVSGTTGEAKRIEAIKIKLNGQLADFYDVYYKVHVQGFGDLGWAKNDEIAGSIGYSYRLEAFDVILVKKGELLDNGIEHYMENNDGYFVISSCLDSNKVLDAYSELTNNGTIVSLYDRNDSLNQIWKISKRKDGTYFISSALNPNVLLTENNRYLQLFSNSGIDEQFFEIEQLDDGFVSIISKKSGLYLDVIDGKTNNGAEIAFCDKTGEANQKYMLIAYDKKKVYKGLDVSSYQSVDWNLARYSVNFAIIRLGFGSDYSDQDDERFISNIRACEENNIPYGIYIYSYALNAQDAYSEAMHAIRLAKETGSNFQLGIWFDMEDADGYKARHGFFDGNQAAKEVDICETFLRVVSSSGYKAGLYASLSWLNGDLNNSVLDNYSKWVAHWNGPVTFDEAKNGGTSYYKPYKYWQFCSDGHIYGVSGGLYNYVDLDLGYDIFD